MSSAEASRLSSARTPLKSVTTTRATSAIPRTAVSTAAASASAPTTSTSAAVSSVGGARLVLDASTTPTMNAAPGAALTASASASDYGGWGLTAWKVVTGQGLFTPELKAEI